MLPGLEFTGSSFIARYRASPAPQWLDLSFTTDRPPEVAHGPLMLPFLIEAVNLGAAGGAEFAPAAGAARVLHGPVGAELPADSTSYAWRIELSGVSPRFLRVFVERLADPGPGARVTSMSLVGQLAPDLGPLSAHEGLIRSWLDDDEAYPGPWATPGFPIRLRPIGRGAGIRLRFGQDTDHALLLRFTRLIEIWNHAIMAYKSGSGDAQGIADAAPRMSRSKGELAAGYDAFDFLRDPARAVLVNMLTRFHQQAAPIEEAQIALA